jgi:hypothetical protein
MCKLRKEDPDYRPRVARVCWKHRPILSQSLADDHAGDQIQSDEPEDKPYK